MERFFPVHETRLELQLAVVPERRGADLKVNAWCLFKDCRLKYSASARLFIGCSTVALIQLQDWGCDIKLNNSRILCLFGIDLKRKGTDRWNWAEFSHVFPDQFRWWIPLNSRVIMFVFGAMTEWSVGHCMFALLMDVPRKLISL